MIGSAQIALDKLSTLAHSIEAIESIAKEVLGDTSKDAFEALHIIAVIIDAVRSGFHDKLSVEDVRKEIKTLRATLQNNDAAADQALHDKFDKSPA
jgi:hypothetical protein